VLWYLISSKNIANISLVFLTSLYFGIVWLYGVKANSNALTKYIREKWERKTYEENEM
jgi:hypothetical protein